MRLSISLLERTPDGVWNLFSIGVSESPQQQPKAKHDRAINYLRSVPERRVAKQLRGVKC